MEHRWCIKNLSHEMSDDDSQSYTNKKTKQCWDNLFHHPFAVSRNGQTRVVISNRYNIISYDLI